MIFGRAKDFLPGYHLDKTTGQDSRRTLTMKRHGECTVCRHKVGALGTDLFIIDEACRFTMCIIAHAEFIYENQ